MNINYQRSMTYLWQRLFICMVTVFAFLPLMSTTSAYAQSSVCAEVKIVIEQKLSFERQAFDAKMVINNGLEATKIEDVAIELLFLNSKSEAVVATQDPNAVGAKFFYRTDSMTGIEAIEGGGIVAPKSSAEIHWMIIPSAGAAEAAGTLYYVGAKVTYTLNGVQTTVEVTPDYIVVKPQPMLTLDYFLPKDVYADDPFTEVVEPQVPFTLGVRIKNAGGGDAVGTKIESAQPKIVENKQNLLIGFEILGGYVGDELAGKSLLLDFGDVKSASAKVGRWNMVTTLSGKFVEFKASFTHADHLGGAVTSLIQAVNTHTLVHDVKVDLPGRDSVRDFLALDNDVMRVYESDGIDTLVANQSEHARLAVSGDEGQINFPATPGFVFAKVSDPYRGAKALGSVKRSDGKDILAQNVWLSKVFNQDTTWSYFVNVFDVDSTGSYTVKFEEGEGPVGERSSISGVVYFDANNNSTFDEADSGLSLVAVTLSGQSDSGVAVWRTYYTDASGAYVFNDLDAGKYTLEVASRGWMVDSAARIGQSGGIAEPGKITEIKLGAGTKAQGYQFAKNEGTEHDRSDAQLYTTIDNTTPSIGDTINVNFLIGSFFPTSAKDVRLSITWPEGLSEMSCSDEYGEVAHGQWHIQNVFRSEINCSAKVIDLSGEQVIKASLSTQSANLVQGFSSALIPLWAKGAQQSSSIIGVIFNDTNASMAFDGADAGLAHVAVTLIGQDANGNAVSQVVYTDDLGVFTFTGLDKGAYTLEVEPVNGMSDGAALIGNAFGADGVGKITDISLKAGQAASTYLFAKRISSEMRMDLGLKTAVINENGEDLIELLEGIQVGDPLSVVYIVENSGPDIAMETLVQIDWTQGLSNVACYEVDAFGQGVLEGDVQYIEFPGLGEMPAVAIENGQWHMGAVKPMHMNPYDEPRIAICAFEVGSLAGNQNIKAQVSSQTPDVDITNNSSTVTLNQAVANAAISGMVYEQGESGIQGVKNVAIELRCQDEDGGAVSLMSSTDEAGAFTFSGLVAGRYTLHAQPVDGMLDGAASVGQAGGVVTQGFISNIGLVSGAKVGEYRFEKRTGVVAKSSLSGIVNLQDSTGMSDVKVYLQGDANGNSVEQEIYTDATGAFTFGDLSAGTYSLRVDHIDGTALAGQKPGTAGGSGTAGGVIHRIILREGMQAQGYIFTKRMFGGSASISGMVYVDTNKNGVLDVGETGAVGSRVWLLGGASDIVIYSDESGKFAFNGLTKGTYSLSADFGNRPFDGVMVAGTAGGSTLNKQYITNIVLTDEAKGEDYYFGYNNPPKSSSLAGTVYADTNGNGVLEGNEAGIGGVKVNLTGSDEHTYPVQTFAYTDAAGRFAFNGLRRGGYSLRVDPVDGVTNGSSFAGTAGGVASATTGSINSININANGVNGTGYTFARLVNTTRGILSAQVAEDNASGGAASSDAEGAADASTSTVEKKGTCLLTAQNTQDTQSIESTDSEAAQVITDEQTDALGAQGDVMAQRVETDREEIK